MTHQYMTTTIIIGIASLIVWVLLSTPFQLRRERKKIAKMAALDQMGQWSKIGQILQ